MKLNKNKTTTAVAVYGAALGAMYAAPELHASVVDIGFTPGTVSVFNFAAPVNLAAQGLNATAFVFVDNSDFFGKNFYDSISYFANMQAVQSSQSIAPGGLSGYTVTNPGNASGTQFIAFETLGGNIGWWQVDLGGPGGDITFLQGKFGNQGETLHVEAQTVPEPAALGLLLLSLGAAGVRYRKKARNPAG